MSSLPTIALIAVTKTGVDHARTLRQRLKRGTLYYPENHGGEQVAWERPYADGLSGQIATLFTQYDQLVFFLATGAVTRLIAPHLNDKTTDPGVLAIDEAASFVIPILSGHQGGANAFALTIAGLMGATPVITTASDVIGGLSPDLLEDRYGWIPEPRERLKAAAAALVNQKSVALVQEIGQSGSWLADQALPEQVYATHHPDHLPSQPFDHTLWITDRIVGEIPALDPEHIMWYRPKSLVLGVGCERGISLEALEDGVNQFLQQTGFAKASITALASLDLKADETAMVDLAHQQGWQTHFYPAEDLAQVPGIATPSAVVEQSVGTPGVAEPAALKAAQADTLLVTKHIMSSPAAPQRMTFALARSSAFQDRSTRSGNVTFIGAGPGDPDLLTLKAQRVLAQADVVIYAGSLIPEAILHHAPATATLHNSAPLTLEDVMTLTFNAVRDGKQVVRLQSGDLSLYSAIQEQMALLDDAEITYDAIPGISAFQAAAAKLHSELTIPEVVQTIILTRGEGQTPMPSGESLVALAAHQASLCIFLSAKLSRKVQDQLLTAYAPDTPVAILYRVSWPDEQIVMTELQHLHREIRANKLIRTTLILVGNAIGARKNRSHLYNTTHAHIFRRRGELDQALN